MVNFQVSGGVHSHSRNHCLVPKHQWNFNKPGSTRTKLSSPHRNRLCENDPYRPPARRNQGPQGRWASQEYMLQIPGHMSSTRPRFLLRRHHTADSGPRRKKGRFQMCFANQVNDLLVDGCVDDVKEARKEIHTKVVCEALASRGTNGVLGSAAPDVDAEEVGLPRGTRTTLAQLRSGYCSALSTFRHRIGLSPAPTCPCCRQADHTTQHLFSCPEHPTELSPLDLWRRSRGTAAFLQIYP